MASASIPNPHFNMVPPDGVSPTNEQEGDHEKRSQAAAAIRRGNIKISKPILDRITWVEGVPDASSQHQLGSHIVSPEVEEEHEEREGEHVHGLAVSTHGDHAREPSPHLHHQGSSQFTRETVHSQARSTPIDPRLDQRDSVIEVAPPSQMDAKKKRRSGTIRTVLRKVFGRKEKTQSKQLSPPSRPGTKHEHSRSVSRVTLVAAHKLTMFRNPSQARQRRLQRTEAMKNFANKTLCEVSLRTNTLHIQSWLLPYSRFP